MPLIPKERGGSHGKRFSPRQSLLWAGFKNLPSSYGLIQDFCRNPLRNTSYRIYLSLRNLNLSIRTSLKKLFTIRTALLAAFLLLMVYGLINTMTIRRIDESVSQRIYPSVDDYGLIREINKNFTLTTVKLTSASSPETVKTPGLFIAEINSLTAKNDSLFHRLSQNIFKGENELQYGQLVEIRKDYLGKKDVFLSLAKKKDWKAASQHQYTALQPVMINYASGLADFANLLQQDALRSVEEARGIIKKSGSINNTVSLIIIISLVLIGVYFLAHMLKLWKEIREFIHAPDYN